MLVLSRRDLQALLPPRDVIDAVEEAFREAAAGRVRALPRAVLPIERGGLLLTMASAVPRRRAVGTKLVTVAPGNMRRGLPTLHVVYVLTDPVTGVPLAVMEAGFLTAIRTGAASAVATRYLARADARRVACFGASIQAEYQLRCLAAVRPLSYVAVVGRRPARARAFAMRMRRALGIPVAVTTGRAAAVREAD